MTGRACRRSWMAITVALLLFVGGCSGRPTDRTPEGALQLFLQAMDRADQRARARREAYSLLSPESREALADRARLAESYAHRSFEPWEMLPPGRFRLRFPIRRNDGFSSEIDGDTAVVTVHGVEGEDRAEVPMVKEDDRWRVALEIGGVSRAPSPTKRVETDYQEY